MAWPCAGEIVGWRASRAMASRTARRPLGRGTPAPAGSTASLGRTWRRPRCSSAAGSAALCAGGAAGARCGAAALVGGQHPAHAHRGRRAAGLAARVGRTRAGWPSRLIRRFRVKAGGAEAVARTLSGGNLQKFIVGRGSTRPRSCSSSASPPGAWTWAQRRRSRRPFWRCATRAAAVLVFSEELDGLFELCDRLHVIAQGRLSPSLPIEAATRAS